MAKRLRWPEGYLETQPYIRSRTSAPEPLLGSSGARFAARFLEEEAGKDCRLQTTKVVLRDKSEVATRPAFGVITEGPEEPYVNSTSTVL